MDELTPDDVKHWDISVIRQIFETAAKQRDSDHQLGEKLLDADKRTAGWEGESGNAFREELGKTRTDVNAAGNESDRVNKAVQRAEADITYCKNKMDNIYDSAHDNGWTVTQDWRIDDSDANDAGQKHDPELLQNDLDQLKTRAHAADHELAVALRAAVGDAELDADGNEVNSPRDVGGQERPGVTDVNDPGVTWKDGFDPSTWDKSWHNPLLADNPPGYAGPAGAGRDAAWQDYLAHFPKDGKGYLPNPDAVNDPGLKAVGAAGTQLGTSYAWDGGGTKGPGKGVLNREKDGTPIYDESWTFHDDKRTGFDCSGLAEYAAGQAQPGVDIGGWTGAQLDSSNLTNVPAGEPLKPGDFIYYGAGPADHVGIYVAPGVIINAPQSGLPVQLDHRATVPDGDLVRVRRLP